MFDESGSYHEPPHKVNLQTPTAFAWPPELLLISFIMATTDDISLPGDMHGRCGILNNRFAHHIFLCFCNYILHYCRYTWGGMSIIDSCMLASYCVFLCFGCTHFQRSHFVVIVCALGVTMRVSNIQFRSVEMKRPVLITVMFAWTQVWEQSEFVSMN